MKYSELIHFDPILSVVKLVDSGELSVAEMLIKTYVFSKKIKEDLQNVILKNLNPDAGYETKGIQIVGSYGTGKSHLMSLVSSIAENSALIDKLQDEEMRQSFRSISGRYIVLRFEIGNDKQLKDIVFFQIERYLNSIGVNFSFDPESKESWKDQLKAMMAEFQEKFPDKHFLIVIDEMLEYLKGRKPSELNNDLMLLRQMGELCDNSRFKIMFGIQELLYRSPEFQFQAEMLNKIEDRYQDLIITKEDVAFVVKERLLKKDLHQKQRIRTHLLKFSHLFDGINTNLNEYVDLFPVHPGYVNYFEKIKHGKNQREILKVLSNNFEKLMDTEVPENNPGLLTYDQYWLELAPAMSTFPDIRIIKDKMELIEDKVSSHFKGARANKKEIALKIARALAIRILSDDLDKHNGANAHSLKEDLCVTMTGVDDPELLLANIDNTAKQIVTATTGQYIVQDEMSGVFYIRTEGGINISQVIRDYADEVIKRDPDQADQYYFDFLQYILGLQQNTYRTGFKIWEHSLEWIDKKSFRLGYIFFGNPNERSTTEPIQQYYIFFCPLFNPTSRNDEADEVYFDMNSLSDEFKDTIYLYGAGRAIEGSAASNQKQLFKSHNEESLKRAIGLFEKEFAEKVRVLYKGSERKLNSYSLPGEGFTKDAIFGRVAATVLNNHFNEKFEHYPSFKDLLQPITKDNFDGAIQKSLKKVTNPEQSNREGEAILSGLGLWSGQSIDTQNSKYADGILQKFKGKDNGTVLNRNDILYPHYAPQNLWYSCDYNLDHQLEFVVLTALAYKGDIEIVWSQNKYLSASNIETVHSLNKDDLFTFQSIRRPQGIPYKNLKAMFSCLGLPDLTTELEKPETISKILTEAKNKVERVVKASNALQQGLKCRGVFLLTSEATDKMTAELNTLHTLLDGIQQYNTYGKLKAFKFTEDEIIKTFKAFEHCSVIENLKARAAKFEKLIGYLNTAQSYVIESDQPLYDDISEAVKKLGSVIISNTNAEIKQYEALLNSLVDKYAEYYINYYTKCRLSTQEARHKDRLMNGETKRICDIIKDSEFINSVEYTNWLNTITFLREADSSLTKTKVKEEPYHDFNPREYYGKTVLNIRELEEQLDSIFEKWVKAMRSVFKDPSVQENLVMLASTEKRLAEEFRDSKTEITLANAPSLRNIIIQLTQSIDRIEVLQDDLRKQFARPYTPGEAIEEFTKYIDSLCAGKERNKVRIIFK
jgi:hypothetical protein